MAHELQPLHCGAWADCGNDHHELATGMVDSWEELVMPTNVENAKVEFNVVDAHGNGDNTGGLILGD
eukprot:1466121-Karenia_brevis.AAC.1